MKLSDLKPLIFVVGFLAKKQTQKQKQKQKKKKTKKQKNKNKKKKPKTKAFRIIKALEPPNQNVVNIKEVLEQFVKMVLKAGSDRIVRLS